MVELPTDPEISKILIESIKRDCTDEVVGIVSIMQYHNGIFFRAREDNPSE